MNGGYWVLTESSHFTEIAVSFQFSQYGVIEGQTVTVCASIVSGTSNIAFTLGLSAVHISTEGKSVYIILFHLFTYPYCFT